jgi:hypothetical protein
VQSAIFFTVGFRAGAATQDFHLCEFGHPADMIIEIDAGRPPRCPRKFNEYQPALHQERSEAVTHLSYRRRADRWLQPTSSNEQKQPWSTGPSLGNELHDLGNLMVAMHFCLQRLRGRQCSAELEEVARSGLELSQQGMAIFRKLDEAVRVRP